mgnify:CR=1 FL=1
MGIDGLTQLLAFALFLVGFAGIALIVVNATRGQAARGGIVLAAVGIIGGIIFLFVSEGILQVGPTERAVVFNNITGELSEDPLEPGIHVIIPVLQQSFIYRVSRQEYTMSGIANEGARNEADAIEARSIDGQEVFVDVTLIFTIAPDDVEEVHRNWSDVQQGYTEGLIRPQVRSIVRDVIAASEAEQIFGGDRTQIQADIQERLTVELGAEGFTVIDFLLREINFSDSFITAIEDRQVEELRRDRAEIEAQRVQTEAEGRANATIEEARGNAESQRINAQAEADVIRLRAEAEADALRLVSEQIAANPNLLQYEYIQNLADNVEISIIPSNTPFLFDASTFQDVGGDDFEAPTVPQLPSSSNSGDNTDNSDNSGNSGN